MVMKMFKFLNNKKKHRMMIPFVTTEMLIEVETDMEFDDFIKFMNENVISSKWSEHTTGIFTLRNRIISRIEFHFGNVKTFGLIVDGKLTRIFVDDERSV